jgi:hypothetical protein
MDSWTDSFGGQTRSTYSEDPFGMCVEAFAAYGLTPRHILRLSVERLAAEPSMHSIIVPTDENGNPIGPTFDAFIEWTISTTPVALTYEFRPTRHDALSPFVGVGGGYFFSKVEGRVVSEVLGSGVQTLERRGEGYGVHIDLGIRIPAGEKIAVTCTLRGRYSDGMAFTDEDGAIPVEFTGLSVIIGLGARAWGT